MPVRAHAGLAEPVVGIGVADFGPTAADYERRWGVKTERAGQDG
ncbi:hypothetical protein ACFV6E_13835 [Streptomyces sp. NPDC059785]